MQSSMLHGSEPWLVIKENAVWGEVQICIWMCGIKLQNRVPSKGLRERLGLDDIISVLGSGYYSKTGCDAMGMCCEKKTMIG